MCSASPPSPARPPRAVGIASISPPAAGATVEWGVLADRIGKLGFTHLLVPIEPDPSSFRATGSMVRLLADAPTPEAGASFDRWVEALADGVRSGVSGFRCLRPDRLPAGRWRDAMEQVRRHGPCEFFAWTPGMARGALRQLEGTGFDGVFGSLAWWDGKSDWIVDEHEALRRVAPVIPVVRAPDEPLAPGPHGLSPKDRWRLAVAAATGAGLFVPIRDDWADAIEGEASAAIVEANRTARRIAELGFHGEMRLLGGTGRNPCLLLRADHGDIRQAGRALVIASNADVRHGHPLPPEATHLPADAGAPFGSPRALDDTVMPDTPLAPGEVRLLTAAATVPVARKPPPQHLAARKAAAQPRIAIEAVSPAVDGGRFPAKAITGQPIHIEADLFADGHDRLAAAALWRAADEDGWTSVPMRPVGNDRWRATVTLHRLGRHFFTVEAWCDTYASYQHELEAKRKAGQDVTLEVAEGRLLLTEAAGRAEGAAAAHLHSTVETLERRATDEGAALLLDEATRAAFATADARPFLVRHDPALAIEIERPQAAFASWYEMFPRSATDDPARHGTFDDVVRHLPSIRAMGFDVLYFPPIHPIGVTNRKGRNNSLTAQPGDVGSPYAIGGADGGHDAIHRELGTIEDFRRLRHAAAEQGLEIALDFAVQCSPDHPWLKEHPEWFRWRPDGSLRYAENPPKKYEDIVNVDFYAGGAVPGLWLALRDVVVFWASEGVRTFRVDNPHTKPLPFWEWLIADVRQRYPDAIFLSEAFTRPKVMNRLAKVGFSQSYTYFTWRNTKRELADYLTELTTGDAKDFFRPHFFVNTPDINPVFLQSSGRPGFLIRAALAATLSGLWGVYSGFELCEAAALPGREEYLDSEKYEIRVRDPEAPGNITAEITRLNRIRRAHPALHDHRLLRFYNAFDDRVLLYGKATEPLRDMILVAVNLDPHRAIECDYELPLWEWGLPDHGTLAVEDLMRDHRFLLTGKRQRLRLDPADLPFTIWRIAPPEVPAP